LRPMRPNPLIATLMAMVSPMSDNENLCQAMMRCKSHTKTPLTLTTLFLVQSQHPATARTIAFDELTEISAIT
jgi:trimethylamine:corrinoid methyltransferase-like protein